MESRVIKVLSQFSSDNAIDSNSLWIDCTTHFTWPSYAGSAICLSQLSHCSFCREALQAADVSGRYGFLHGHVSDHAGISLRLLLALQRFLVAGRGCDGALLDKQPDEYEEFDFHEGGRLWHMARRFLHCMDGWHSPTHSS